MKIDLIHIFGPRCEKKNPSLREQNCTKLLEYIIILILFYLCTYFRFQSTADFLNGRNTCLLSSRDIRSVKLVRDRAWDLYEILDTTLCRGRESLQGMLQ